jgi:hypothetical protein
MAEFILGTGSSHTPTQHSNRIFSNYLAQMSLNGLMGKPGSGMPIIVDNTLKGEVGDTVRYHFIPQVTGEWILGQNATVLGNEESMDEYSMDLTIDQMAKAFRKKGKMTDKRIIWKFRERARLQLQNWWAQRSEDLLVWAMTGLVSGQPTGTYAALIASMASATATTDLVNGAGRCIKASGANASEELSAANSDNTALYTAGTKAMTAADKMSPRLIEDAVVMAKTSGTYKVAPVKVGKNGEEFYKLLVHTRAARDLRFHPDWQARSLSCADRGIGDDPIATGALGVWNNVIVAESERIVRFGVSGTLMLARNLLLGADACVLGWAQTLDYTEELIDHKRILSMAADEIRGQKKLQFNSIDTGVCQVVTAAN